MATVEKVGQILKALSLYYDKFSIIEDKELNVSTVEMWCIVLQDVPDNVLEAATRQYMHDNVWPPNGAAGIIEIAEKLMRPRLPLPIEAYEFTINFKEKRIEVTDEWTEDNKVICIEHTYEWIHPLVEQTAKAMGWPKLFPTDNPMADKAQFIKAYESFINREIEQNKLLPEVKQASEKYQLEIGSLVKKLESGK
jgi:hypothetical protein